jgi:hypothetical protein
MVRAIGRLTTARLEGVPSLTMLGAPTAGGVAVRSQHCLRGHPRGARPGEGATKGRERRELGPDEDEDEERRTRRR